MDAAADLLMGALEKAKEALDKCKDAVDLAIDVQGVFNFMETVVIMIPKRGQSLEAQNEEEDPTTMKKVMTAIKDEIMQSNTENEKTMKKKRQQSLNLRAKVNKMWENPHTKSLDVTFLGLNACITLASETLDSCAETLGKIDPNVSCLWFFMPWKMVKQLKAKEDLEKNAMEVERLATLIQTAIGVASYGIQLEVMESMFDATALIKNYSVKKFWQENIGRDKTSVSISDLQESFLNYVFSNSKNSRLSQLRHEYRALQRGDKDDRLIYATRRLQDLLDSGNRDSNVTIFELSRTLDENGVGDEDDFMVDTVERILKDYRDFLQHFTIEIESLRPVSKRAEKLEKIMASLTFKRCENSKEYEDFVAKHPETVIKAKEKDGKQANNKNDPYCCIQCDSKEYPCYVARHTETAGGKAGASNSIHRNFRRCESCYEGDVVVRPREEFKVIATWKRPKEWVEYECDRFVVMKALRDSEIRANLEEGLDVEHPTKDDEMAEKDLDSVSQEVSLRRSHSSSKSLSLLKKGARAALAVSGHSAGASSASASASASASSPVASAAASPPPHPMGAMDIVSQAMNSQLSSAAAALSGPLVAFENGKAASKKRPEYVSGNTYTFKMEFPMSLESPGDGLFDVRMCMDSKLEKGSKASSQLSYLLPLKSTKIVVEDVPSVSFATVDFDWKKYEDVYKVDPRGVYRKVLTNPDINQEIPVVFYLDKTHTQQIRRISLVYFGPKEQKEADEHELETWLITPRWQEEEKKKVSEDSGKDDDKQVSKSKALLAKEKRELKSRDDREHRYGPRLVIHDRELDVAEKKAGAANSSEDDSENSVPDFNCSFTLPDLDKLGIDSTKEDEYLFKIQFKFAPESKRRSGNDTLKKSVKDLDLIVKFSKDLPAKLEIPDGLENYFHLSEIEDEQTQRQTVTHLMDESNQFRTILGNTRVAPSTVSFYYYEVEILNGGVEDPSEDLVQNIIGVGFASEDHTCAEDMPGWTTSSYAFHGDDGSVFHGPRNLLLRSGQEFGAGDVIGCAWDVTNRRIFFTKKAKGEHKGSIILDEHNAAHVLTNVNPNIGLYPAIGFGSKDAQVRVDFGAVKRIGSLETFLSEFARDPSTYRDLDVAFGGASGGVSYTWRFGLSGLIDGAGNVNGKNDYVDDGTVVNFVGEISESGNGRITWQTTEESLCVLVTISANWNKSTRTFSNGEIDLGSILGGLKVTFDSVAYDQVTDTFIADVVATIDDDTRIPDVHMDIATYIDEDHDGEEDGDDEGNYGNYWAGYDDDEDNDDSFDFSYKFGGMDDEDGSATSDDESTIIGDKQDASANNDDDEASAEDHDDEKSDSVDPVQVKVEVPAAAASAAPSATPGSASIAPKPAATPASSKPASSANNKSAPSSPAPAPAPVAPKKEGFISKLGGMFKSTPQRRWFVLDGSKLSYYKEKGDSTAAGDIDLGPCTISEESGLNFTITVPGSSREPYALIAESAESKTEWLKTLRDAVAFGSKKV